ncbi:MAG: restriction endonuclease [Candidatus Saccharibacteria bacterium]|nr:restriction endonuclease [Candidatus Saccharibacteria bacterium]
MLSSQDFKQYRLQLGFSNQEKAKKFLSGKDIIPDIDFNYLQQLKERTCQIIARINSLMPESLRSDIKLFEFNTICSAYKHFTSDGLIHKMNNLGRRKEEMTFAWLRGYAVVEYFLPTIMKIFGNKKIKRIGDDSLENISDFRKTPTADLELSSSQNQPIRLEIQSGFQGINDIKQHKITEARRRFVDQEIETIVIHFDLFNGQVAFVNISQVAEDNVRWITRQQLEGQTVFEIDPNNFIWLLAGEMPSIVMLEEELCIRL